MQTMQEICAKLKQRKLDLKLTYDDIKGRSNLSKGVIAGVFKGQQNLRFSYVLSVAKALEIDVKFTEIVPTGVNA